MAANRSSLELMLEKIQQLEDRPDDIPPALPVRPVSRARLPRARRPVQLHFQKRNCDEERMKNEDGQEILSGQCGQFRTEIERMENSSVEKRICVIQKWYRGHRVRRSYGEFARGVLVLQSFVRGDNARRNYQLRAKRNDDKATVGIADETKVQYDFLMDLRSRVLRTEARAREKKEENVALKLRVEEMERKWRKVEERMELLEKTWQDQLRHIQACLAAAKKLPPPQIRFRQYDPSRHCRHSSASGGTLDLPIYGTDHLADQHDEDGDNNNGDLVECKLHPQEELCRLKNRFKAWKKEYRSKLRDVQTTFRKIGHSQPRKNWWGRRLK